LVSILSHMNPLHTPHSLSVISILILTSHLIVGLQSDIIPSELPNKTCMH
jgi:hypothetical protein